MKKLTMSAIIIALGLPIFAHAAPGGSWWKTCGVVGNTATHVTFRCATKTKGVFKNTRIKRADFSRCRAAENYNGNLVCTKR